MNNKKNFLLTVITNSEIIKKRISPKDRINLMEEIVLLPDEKISKLFNILEKIDFGELQRKIERGLIIAAVLPVPFTTELYVVYKLLTRLNYQCLYKCNTSKKKVLDKKLCYKKCNVMTLEKAIVAVKKEISDCWYEKNPEKCKKNGAEYLKKLYEKLEKEKIALNNYEHEIQINERNKKLKFQKKKEKLRNKK